VATDVRSLTKLAIADCGVATLIGIDWGIWSVRMGKTKWP
jgi:hypothetical protein